MANISPGPSRREIQSSKPSVPDYYYDLNLPQTATNGQIKKSYRKLALIHHPDKEGDATSFHKASHLQPPRPDPVDFQSPC